MQALALKYRPKSFEQLIGQDAIAKSLAHALDSGRLSHAYLFSGLRGSGKTSTARIFAKALLCDKGPTGKPCEVCDNCVMANEGRHIDIIEMERRQPPQNRRYPRAHRADEVSSRKRAL